MVHLVRSLLVLRRIFFHKNHSRKRRPATFNTLPHPDAHPNLHVTYERARELEASLARNAADITNKVAAQVAVFGFAVVGVLSAIDRYVWGFVQRHQHLLLDFNYACLAVTFVLGVVAAINLSRAFTQTQTVYPWAEEMRMPDQVTHQEPDQLLKKLVTDLHQSNEINAQIVRRQNRHLSVAAGSLVLLSVLIVLQTGYNAARKSMADAQVSDQKAGPPCQCSILSSGTAAESIMRPQPARPSMPTKVGAFALSSTARTGKKPLRSTRTGSESAPGAIRTPASER